MLAAEVWHLKSAKGKILASKVGLLPSEWDCRPSCGNVRQICVNSRSWTARLRVVSVG